MERQIDRKQLEILEYLRSMLGQLRIMADAERFDMLAYLIEMSYIEAGDLISNSGLSARDDDGNSAAGVPLKPPGKIKLQ